MDKQYQEIMEKTYRSVSEINYAMKAVFHCMNIFEDAYMEDEEETAMLFHISGMMVNGESIEMEALLDEMDKYLREIHRETDTEEENHG